LALVNPWREAKWPLAEEMRGEHRKQG